MRNLFSRVHMLRKRYSDINGIWLIVDPHSPTSNYKLKRPNGARFGEPLGAGVESLESMEKKPSNNLRVNFED